jgi:hypothetical protein
LDWFKDKLRAAITVPIFVVDNITPTGFLELKFLMTCIKDKVVAEGAWVEPQNHTLETVTTMYGAAL